MDAIKGGAVRGYIIIATASFDGREGNVPGF
jgi:hypothetical protein